MADRYRRPTARRRRQNASSEMLLRWFEMMPEVDKRRAGARVVSLLGQGPTVTASAMPLLTIGFRPFFLLAAIAAAVLVPAWLTVLLLGARLSSPLPPILWHAHEMLFGYTSAVIAGFLLTAAQNWTGQTTARGGLLLALAGLWFAGRLLCALGGALPAVAAVDVAFLPALALCVAKPIVRTRNLRNAGMPSRRRELSRPERSRYVWRRFERTSHTKPQRPTARQQTTAATMLVYAKALSSRNRTSRCADVGWSSVVGSSGVGCVPSLAVSGAAFVVVTAAPGAGVGGVAAAASGAAAGGAGAASGVYGDGYGAAFAGVLGGALGGGCVAPVCGDGGLSALVFAFPSMGRCASIGAVVVAAASTEPLACGGATRLMGCGPPKNKGVMTGTDRTCAPFEK